jgi:HNH endonuclease
MRCIFCKVISDNSTSVEHVLPESFGNEDHILRAGWVCDGCNNYFATKVEKPFLESEFGSAIRHFMRVPSKKNSSHLWHLSTW